MKAVREKFLTVVEAEKVTGVHYTVNHSGKMEGMQSLSTSCLCNEYCKNRSSNSELVCSHCYAQRQMKRYKNLNACLVIIPGLFEPPVRTLRATIPENESHIFR